MRTYHVGLLANGHTAVLQFRESIDCLSCEILEYLGERHETKARARAVLRTMKTDVLADLNARYPVKRFSRVVVD